MRGMRGRFAACLAVVLVAGACAGDESADAGVPGGTTPQPAGTRAGDPASAAAGFPTDPSAPPLATRAPAPATEPAGSPATAAPAPASSRAPMPAQRIAEVSVAVGPTSTVVAEQAEPGATFGDPFGRFVACSGWQDAVGTWSLQISRPGAELTAVSIMTIPPVTGHGVFEATFRLEWMNGSALDAHGLITLDPGLQSGTFVSDDYDVSGTFECTGDNPPEPLGPSAVEVYALLRRGAEQRVVSLAAAPSAMRAACPVAEPGPVEVVGAEGAGTISQFAIGAAPNRLALRVGPTDLALKPEAVQTSPGPGVGTFHAETVDGTVIDGAYRCS